ncbi:dienelactone hydrolase family protein [Nitriliruptor alkaliphilus]|uniref:dienelactone hydrolase family protein n=1 Tax=Nitriliruptor alkaliphilus TaxID=427918 RepID=UPI000695E859|nr:dienelactone hydrolase family protein [Nitriliruptor alkaliphilus]
MTMVVLFHHAQGLTPGIVAFANELRAHGHEIHLPDLFEGATFATVEEGVAHAERTGFDRIVARGVAATEALPADVVYAGSSLGVLPAQKLAQTRPGARGVVLYHGGVPVSTFSERWPDGVPLQLHLMDQDVLGEVDIVEELARAVDGAELFLYPGSAHLFTDSSLDVYDHQATRQVLDRTLELLARVDG